MVEIICKKCAKKFEVQNYRKKSAKFCSIKCKLRSYKKGKDSILWKSKSHVKLICNQCKKKYNERLLRKKRSKFCSKKCYHKWMSENLIGEKRYNWKGGNKRRNEGYYNSKYRKWRMSVFLRDNFTCQFCYKRGCYLEAHHIKEWCDFPELRFILGNGITLCKGCHNLTKKGRKKVG